MGTNVDYKEYVKRQVQGQAEPETHQQWHASQLSISFTAFPSLINLIWFCVLFPSCWNLQCAFLSNLFQTITAHILITNISWVNHCNIHANQKENPKEIVKQNNDTMAW
jgi:hypothetical protein